MEKMDKNNDIMSEEIKETIELLNNMKSKSNECIEMTHNLLLRIKDNEMSTDSGISFLALKNKLFVSYLIDLTFLVWNKIKGKQLEGNDCVKRLVELRTVLEKLRPIHNRLKYRIDKLIKTSNTGSVDANDPLRLKPKFDTILESNNTNEMSVNSDSQPNSDQNSDNDMEVINEKKVSKSLAYVPPKVAQMRFDEENDRKVKAFERAKKKAMNSSIIQELRREFDDGPEEVIDSFNSNRSKANKFIKDRTAYEEEYLTRMNLTKKQQNLTKQVMSMSSLSTGITHFEDISALDIDSAEQFSFQNKKKRSSKQKNSKKFKKTKFSKLRK
jgi:U3 small nucleolar ribonucleoprotein protein LCP5